MRVVRFENTQELAGFLKDIKVDPYGIGIMAPKAVSFAIRIDYISGIAANILKQEMLSIGADAAVSRDTLTGKDKFTACLLMATLSQYSRLYDKLKRQPFGLGQLGKEISETLLNFQKNNFVLELGKNKLRLGKACAIMGVLNLTPDSFSGDGVLQRAEGRGQKEEIEDLARKMVSDGADIIDVGGESSRPGARAISAKEEIRRVVSAIKLISKKFKVPVSIDTYKPEVAKAALDNGAVMINDITGLRDKRMARLAAKYNAAVVIMHMKGVPKNMQKLAKYVSLTDEIISSLKDSVKRAQDAGINNDKIIIDPGIGFAKTFEHNLEILKNLSELKVLGFPMLVGTSRKAFIGKILNAAPQERIFGTVATCVEAYRNGANILRVHDVRQVRQALDVSERIRNICT
ncbi:MAG: dihydropteroate synthase [Candidatus Omnitrophica bacterium]|nr:dihydropteroate synthase [Candidatus Omnitrophota bacterium]